jgi:hypothetical protein
VNVIAGWRESLLHGYVPPSSAAGVLGIDPNHKLQWGGDTNLYRNGANGLKTDSPFDAAVLKQGGTALSPVAGSGDFLDLGNKPKQTSVGAGWPLTEGSGTTGTDASWSGNNLTITSGSWAGASSPLTNAVTIGSSTVIEAANPDQAGRGAGW